MASFPVTSILDKFVGSNQDPISTGWTNTVVGGDTGGLARISNQLTNATGGGTDTDAYFDRLRCGPACEAYITIVTASSTTNDEYHLFVRVQNPLVTFDAYELVVIKQVGADIWRLRRRDGTTPTQLGADMTQEIASGDSIGISAVDSVISAYYKAAAGSWTLVGSRSDSRYPGAGYLAIKTAQSVSQAWKAVDFGGGTIPQSGDDPPIGISGWGAA